MELRRAVVHHIEKESGGDLGEITYSDSILPIDSKAEKLCEKLDKTYNNRSTVIHAKFSDFQNPFPKGIENYLSQTDDPKFLTFSRTSTAKLADKMEGETNASGGYIAYLDYTNQNDASYIGAYLIRNTSGLVFERREDSYHLNELTRLDTNNLAMACKINKDKLESDKGSKCLTLVTKSQGQVSQYFQQWIRVGESISAKEFNIFLTKIINSMPTPTDSNGKSMDRDEFRESASEYLAMSKVINLKELSKKLFDDESKIEDYAEQQGYPINTKFNRNRQVVDGLVHINASSEKFKVTIPRSYNNSTDVKLGDNYLTIFDQDLVEDIKSQSDES
ncbi:MAG: nucleoid-associated protein [Bacteroidota bacterium]